MKTLTLTRLASVCLALAACGSEPAPGTGGHVESTTGKLALDGFSVFPSLIRGGTSTKLSLTTTYPGPSTPTIVAFSADNPAVLIPATATMPAAPYQGQLALDIGTTSVPNTTTVVITATLEGMSKTTTLTLLPEPTPTAVTFAPPTVLPGETAIGTVTLSGPAPAAGFTVELSAERDFPGAGVGLGHIFLPGAVPASVVVPPGMTTATFRVTTLPAYRAFRILVKAIVRWNGAGLETPGTLKVERFAPAGNAVFDAALQAPACGTVDAFCDSGGTIDGYGALADGPEVNTPNTINDSCPEDLDPTVTFHRASSLDRLRVSTLDGTALAAGKQVRIDATGYFAGGWLHLYSAPSATSPAWTSVASLAAPGVGEYVLSNTFTLPPGGLQAIRGLVTANATPDPTPTACYRGNYDGFRADRDDLVFAVNNGGADPNVAPSVNAGPDQIQIPNSGLSASLAGTVIDDGLPAPPQAPTTIWSLVSGPGTATFADATALSTTVTFSAAGTYFLRLTASDGVLDRSDDIMIITPPFNNPPVVNAGADQTLTVAGVPTLINLNGAVTDDGMPDPPRAVTMLWSFVSGPSTPILLGESGLLPVAQVYAFGTYVFRLTANDGGVTVSDDVSVIVNQQNVAPTVNAGADQTITLPSAADLAATVMDDLLPFPPGMTTVHWSMVDGPGTVSFADASSPSTTATFSTAGVYVLGIDVTDGILGASDTVTIVVHPAVVNQAPVVNAGPDQTVTLPAVPLLTGTASDDGLPNPPAALTVRWTKVSGPGTVLFVTPTGFSTRAIIAMAGTYVLQLSVGDGALTTTDTMTLVINPVPPPNRAPTVNAGSDQLVILPATAALSGTATDDGRPNPPGAVTTTWSKVSGPGTVTFGNASATGTAAAFSAPGTYVLRLRASDGSLASTDDVSVTVQATTIKVQYQAGDANANDSQLRPHFNLINTGSSSVALSSLKIRYWYTADSNHTQAPNCDSATIGCSRITHALTTVSPARLGADRYLEVGFTSSAGNLAPGAQTGAIQLRVSKSSPGTFNETNDFSSDLSKLSFVDWTRVTLYRNGTRIWGTEP